VTAQAEETPVAELGRARLRKEDQRLITGQTNWTDNIRLPGMLHVAFLRSPYAHARITSVDVSAALGQPGVIAAYAGADFAAEQGSLPCAWPVTPDIVIPPHPPMATDEVRYVGEAVACVVARDRYAAADALAATNRCRPSWTSGPRLTQVRPRCTTPATRASSGRSPTATWRRRSPAPP
jgi:aerobic carbon-monoxide dehydrogenase large subunit